MQTEVEVKIELENATSLLAVISKLRSKEDIYMFFPYLEEKYDTYYSADNSFDPQQTIRLRTVRTYSLLSTEAAYLSELLQQENLPENLSSRVSVNHFLTVKKKSVKFNAVESNVEDEIPILQRATLEAVFEQLGAFKVFEKTKRSVSFKMKDTKYPLHIELEKVANKFWLECEVLAKNHEVCPEAAISEIEKLFTLLQLDFKKCCSQSWIQILQEET